MFTRSSGRQLTSSEYRQGTMSKYLHLPCLCFVIRILAAWRLGVLAASLRNKPEGSEPTFLCWWNPSLHTPCPAFFCSAGTFPSRKVCCKDKVGSGDGHLLPAVLFSLSLARACYSCWRSLRTLADDIDRLTHFHSQCCNTKAFTIFVFVVHNYRYNTQHQPWPTFPFCTHHLHIQTHSLFLALLVPSQERITAQAAGLIPRGKKCIFLS